MLDRYIRFIINRPGTIVAVIVLITIALGAGLPKLRFDNSLDSMMPSRDAEFLLNEEVKKTYGNNGKFIIMDVAPDNIWSDERLLEFDNLISDIEEYRDFDEAREAGRRQKFLSIAAGAPFNREELLEHYKDDQAYSRLLSRKIISLFGNAQSLDRDQLSKLDRELAKSARVRAERLVDRILSPFTMKDISGRDDTLSAFDLVERDENDRRMVPTSRVGAPELKSRLWANPAFEKGIFYRNPASDEITNFGVLIRLIDVRDYDGITSEIQEIALSHPDLRITMQGIPVLYRQINRYMQHDLRLFMPLVMLVMILIFYLNFRSALGVAFPFITLILADVWVLGLMGHLGGKLTVIGISLPPLMIAVGSSYSIHILNRFALDAGLIRDRGPVEGIRTSLNTIAITLLLASLTTMIGFATLVTNQVSAIREWGLYSAIGTFFAVLIASSLIPALCIFLPKASRDLGRAGESSGKAPVDFIVRFMARLATERTRAVMAVTTAILVFSAIGITFLKTETSISAYFREDDAINVSARLIGERFGGSLGLNILLDSGRTDGAKDPQFLTTVEAVRTWLVAEKNKSFQIGRTDSFTDVIKRMHMAMNNNAPAAYVIPESKSDIADYLEIYSGEDLNSDGRADDFEPYIDQDFRTVNLFARMYEKEGAPLSTSRLNEIIASIRAGVTPMLEERGYRLAISGEPIIITRLAKHVVTGQLMSLFLSLAVVGIVISLLFKNWKAGLVSLIPIGIAVALNFGLMGWAGIRLDIATAIIASITIGIGVDNTIHFLNTFRHHRRAGKDLDDTIRTTLSTAGRAIIYTALALILGFAVLIVSSFKPIIFFALLVGVTFMATTAGALLILPAVIRFTGVDLSESKSNSRFWKYFYIGKIFNIENQATPEGGLR
ncbi:MAG TPA: efflux RND transporter permease subunit [Spirochaetota bacterium]|nr:efflux RND transporter permease subunit [Spirochaetota bacterium]